MKTKKIMFLITCLVIFTSPIYAQVDEGPEAPPAAPIDDHLTILFILGTLLVFFVLRKLTNEYPQKK
jgi:hypothetical protein